MVFQLGSEGKIVELSPERVEWQLRERKLGFPELNMQEDFRSRVWHPPGPTTRSVWLEKK